jgi:hypothetical protein
MVSFISAFGFWFLVSGLLLVMNGDDFLLEGESECTGERVLGQFSIFGAVEENVCHGFSQIGTD